MATPATVEHPSDPDYTHPSVPSNDRLEIVESVRPRLAGVGTAHDLDRLIDEALDGLLPASVTTYLPILVERRVREQLAGGARPQG